jgi:hypothetical protein
LQFREEKRKRPVKTRKEGNWFFDWNEERKGKERKVWKIIMQIDKPEAHYPKLRVYK